MNKVGKQLKTATCYLVRMLFLRVWGFVLFSPAFCDHGLYFREMS